MYPPTVLELGLIAPVETSIVSPDVDEKEPVLSPLKVTACPAPWFVVKGEPA